MNGADESVRELGACVGALQEQINKAQEFENNALMAECRDRLWDTICLFQGQPFYTSKGLAFSYTVKGNEIFVDRKANSKSIIRSSVEIAFEKALQLIRDGQPNYGPKKLKVFGASYIWGIFKRFGLWYEKK